MLSGLGLLWFNGGVRQARMNDVAERIPGVVLGPELSFVG